MFSVETNNVYKEINKTIVLDNINIKLEKGKIYGLVGENGAGKSTLLKILLGLNTYKGEVVIDGFNLRKKYKDAINRIGGIVDYVCLYDYLTGEENLRYFSLLYNVPFSRVDEVLAIVDLKKNKKLVKHYSLGMKQRLGIAISLLKNPNILVLDEPTNGLDPKGIIELRKTLTNLNDKTIIVSSHILSEIEKISNNILFIKDKKVYQKTIMNDDNLEDMMINLLEGNNAQSN